ncbi:MAG: ice-binding family protein [Acidimicrobiales bacterium]|nr:ice-binding family protein [Acidimicrobiales bacterium]
MSVTRAITASVGAAVRPRHISRWFASLAVVVVGAAVMAPAGVADAAQAPVRLGTAGSFAVLAGAGVTNTGPTTINGDLGTFPTTSISGAASMTITGTNHGGDAVTQGAKTDLVTAYNTAAGEGPTTAVPADLGGQTLTPGIYNSASSLGLTGALTLNGGGNPNALFVFQAGSTLTTASASSVVLTNGAQACNVFWQVGSSATLGTGSSFRGTILALTSISVTTGTTIVGRALARNGAVTLDTDTITTPTCTTPTGTTVTTPGSANASTKSPSPNGTTSTGTATPGGTGTGTGTPTGTTATGTLPFTGINPLLPTLGGVLVGSGLLLMGLSSARRRRTSA